MPELRDRQFNLIQFMYGFGAIILLVAALSTVLEWKYSKQLFAVGIIVEIIIFIVSLIDIPPSENSSPREIVFPPDSSSSENSADLQNQPNSEFSSILSALEGLNRTVNQIKNSNDNLNLSVENLKEDYREIQRSNQKFSSTLHELKDQLQQTEGELKSLKKHL